MNKNSSNIITEEDAFSWNIEATQVFQQLKESMCKAPILVTPEFTKTFIVECDASGDGIGVVLMQGHPISFTNHPIKGKNFKNPIYEKEMLAILHTLKKWHPYLIGRHFKVKIDHERQFKIFNNSKRPCVKLMFWQHQTSQKPLLWNVMLQEMELELY